MFPILPILILLLLGPANAERLAAEGRLPAALLAVHLAQSAPVVANVVAPVEKSERCAETYSAGKGQPAASRIGRTPPQSVAVWENPGCPPRAGPQVA